MDATQPSAQKKILIIRFASIGEIILTTPVIRAIHCQIANVEIHLLVNKKYQNLLLDNQYLHKIHTFDHHKDELIESLKAENFDFILDLQNSRLSHSICHHLNVAHISYNSLKIKKLICTRLKINTLPLKHMVDRYFDAANEIGISNDGKGLDFSIPDEEKFDISDLPVFFEDGYVAVILDADKGTKRIPLNKLEEIIAILLKPVILIGEKNVAQIGDELAVQLGERVYNACGKFSLFQQASIIAQSNCVLTGDNGLMQVAAAFDKPICSLWGSTIPEFGTYPYIPQHRNLFRMFEICSIKCRPCGKRGFKKCPHRNFKCMNRISALEVADWINQY